ncbi:sensor histidine kinase [Vibrio vulnificus]
MKLIELIEGFSAKKPNEQLLLLQKLSSYLDEANSEEILKAIDSTDSNYLKNILNSHLSKMISREFEAHNELKSDPKQDIDIEAIRSEAFAESISQVLHELEPIIGPLMVHATKEIENFEDSNTAKDLVLLEETMQSFEDWIKVEKSVRYSMVSISELVAKEASSLSEQCEIKINSTLSESLSFVTDKSMVRIIVSNALRNAIQATDSAKYESSPILINAGVTDRSLWLSIIDNGEGLRGEKEMLMKSKFTTKPGNKGMGLAILNKAVLALSGEWELKNGASRGAEFHLELPKREE